MLQTTIIYKAIAKYTQAPMPPTGGTYDGSVWTIPSGWSATKPSINSGTQDLYEARLDAWSSDGGTTWVSQAPDVWLNKDNGFNFQEFSQDGITWSATPQSGVEFTRFYMPQVDKYTTLMSLANPGVYLRQLLGFYEVLRSDTSGDLEGMVVRGEVSGNNHFMIRVGNAMAIFGRSSPLYPAEQQDFTATIALPWTFTSIKGALATPHRTSGDVRYSTQLREMAASSIGIRCFGFEVPVQNASLQLNYFAFGAP